MKVVLSQDVKSIGKKGEVHEVSDGYARNYLFPRKLAVAADNAALNEVKTKAEAQQHHADEALAAAKATAAKLDGKVITVKARAGKGGKLFGAVTAKDAAEAIRTALGLDIDKRKVIMEDMKAFGKCEAEVKVYPGVSAKITVSVEE